MRRGPGTTSLRAVVVAVLLVYVVVLNGFIVSIMYTRHTRQVILWVEGTGAGKTRGVGIRAAPDAVFAGGNTSTRALARPVPVCSDEVAVAVLARAESTARSAAGTLARLRSATAGASVLILLVVTPTTISPHHHTWCATLPCRMVLVDDDGLAPVMHAVAARRPCLNSVALLEDGVRVDASFLARLALAHPARATCLAGGHGLVCPALAWRLPRTFLLAHGRTHSTTTTPLDIGATAQLMGISAPPLAVVGAPR